MTTPGMASQRMIGEIALWVPLGQGGFVVAVAGSIILVILHSVDIIAKSLIVFASATQDT